MYRKKLLRLKGYDYRTANYYFITICTANRDTILGECNTGDVVLTPVGEIVKECWEKIAQFNSHVRLDEFIVMPNHVHGLLNFHGYAQADAVPRRCSGNSLRGSLATIICAFKAASTKRSRNLSGHKDPIWQEGYYEHIIRSDKSLQNIRAYILNNPILWHLDELNNGRTSGAPLH